VSPKLRTRKWKYDADVSHAEMESGTWEGIGYKKAGSPMFARARRGDRGNDDRRSDGESDVSLLIVGAGVGRMQ